MNSRDPASVRAVETFIEEEVRGAEAFFILGDLFDLWIGPAQLDEPGLAPALDAIRSLARNGTAVTILQGNRDFLLGPREAADLGAAIPGESASVEVQGKRLLLVHGDVFCTRDRAYQRMKKVLRSRTVRTLAAILPAPAVRLLARRLRARSGKAVAAKQRSVTSLHIPDVESLVREKGYDAVICGHVHRSEERDLPGGARLIVLSEWTDGRGVFALARDGLIERRTHPGAGGPTEEKSVIEGS
jgi:UDP-2,3-diacylglucosamine hydrolase